MKLYSCFIIAFYVIYGSDSSRWVANPVTIVANNEEEANDKLQKTLYSIYPVNKGYFGHSSKVLEVSSDLYLQAYPGYAQ